MLQAISLLLLLLALLLLSLQLLRNSLTTTITLKAAGAATAAFGIGVVFSTTRVTIPPTLLLTTLLQRQLQRLFYQYDKGDGQSTFWCCGVRPLLLELLAFTLSMLEGLLLLYHLFISYAMSRLASHFRNGFGERASDVGYHGFCSDSQDLSCTHR